MIDQEAYRLGMRRRSNNVSIEDVRKELENSAETTAFKQDMIRGWLFMNNLIYALDLLEGKA